MKGVYMLFDKDEIVYVGQSKDIYRRIYEHSNGRTKGEKKQFDSWEYFKVEAEEERILAERILIRILKPKYNIDTTGHYSKKFPHSPTKNKTVSYKGGRSQSN